MTPDRFLAERSPVWTRLEDMIRQAGRFGAAKLSDEQLHELLRLYPSVAVDVARAKLLDVAAPTRARINSLALAAHGLLYRRRHTGPWRAIGNFFLRDYPRLYRRQWRATLLTLALFAAGTLGTYTMVRLDPPSAYIFVPGGLDVSGGDSDVSAADVSERYRRMPKPPMATGIMANNISVAFMAFAMGILAGLGTCYVLLVNSMMLGAFFAHFDNHGLTYTCYSFLVPHGVLEIFAILVACTAGLRLGMSLALPGSMTRTASLRHGAREAVMLVLGTVPMFMIAGLIEGFITPSYLGGGAKIAIGVIVGGAVILYLLLGGRMPAESIVTRSAARRG